MSKSAARKRRQEAEEQRQAAEGMRAYVSHLVPGEAVRQYIRTMSDDCRS